MALSRNTRDHDEIREWAEARGAVPAEVTRTHTDDEPGILRFCFPDAVNRNDKNLREISWDEFFEKFDENNLELVYQEKTADGDVSNFNKLVHPESVAERARGRSGSGSRSTGSTRSGSTSSRSTNSRSAGSRSAGSGSRSSESRRSGSGSSGTKSSGAKRTGTKGASSRSTGTRSAKSTSSRSSGTQRKSSQSSSKSRSARKSKAA